MQINHEKHCGGSLAAGGVKPPLSLLMYIERLPHPFGRQHVRIAFVWYPGIVELNDVSHQSPPFFKVMGAFPFCFEG